MTTRLSAPMRAIAASAATGAAALLAGALLAGCGGGGSDSTSTGRAAPAFKVGGVFTGLSQGSVTISNGLDRIEIATRNDGVIRDVPFAFDAALPEGAGYNVKVERTDSGVTCETRNGTGIVGQAAVTDVLIQCFLTPSLRLLAGSLLKPDTDGIASSIAFTAESIAVAADGSIYIGADEGLGARRPLLRRITPTGFLTTIAGGTSGDPVDGTGAAARLNRPRALTVEPSGNILFTDGTAVRRVTPDGVVKTIAGSLTEQGYRDTPAGVTAPDPLDARFTRLEGLALAADGAIYVTDMVGSYVSGIRRIGPDGRVSTVVERDYSSSGRAFAGLTMGLDGELYVGTDRYGEVNRVRFAGGAVQLEPLPELASFFAGVSALVPETPTSLIAVNPVYGQIARFFTDGRPAEPVAGNYGSGSDISQCLDGKLQKALFRQPQSAAFLRPGQLLVADPGCKSIRLVDLTTERVSTPYGSLGYGTTDGQGSAASFHAVSGLAYNRQTGSLMTSEMWGLLVRSVSLAGIVHTIAGEPTNKRGLSVSGEKSVDGTGSDAMFVTPSGLAIDAYGSAFVLDVVRGAPTSTLRQIDAGGNVKTLRADLPLGPEQRYLTLDSMGRFIAAFGHAIWRFGADPGSPMERLAGTGTAGLQDCDVPGCASTGAQFSSPTGVVAAADGSVYVADSGNHAIRRITPDGKVQTISANWGNPVALALTDNQDFLIVLDAEHYVVRAVDLRVGAAHATRTIVGDGSSSLALGPLPGSLAPPVVYSLENLHGGGWSSRALAVHGSKLYIALGDAILEADLALR